MRDRVGCLLGSRGLWRLREMVSEADPGDRLGGEMALPRAEPLAIEEPRDGGIGLPRNEGSDAEEEFAVLGRGPGMFPQPRQARREAGDAATDDLLREAGIAA